MIMTRLRTSFWSIVFLPVRASHSRFSPAALAARSRVFADMQGICRALTIVEVEQDESGTTLHAADIAVRNFGGRFGRTTMKFDNNGELISEVANI